MQPIIRIIDVEQKDGKITLTKEQLEDIVKQAYIAGIQDSQPENQKLYEPTNPYNIPQPINPINPVPINPINPGPIWYGPTITCDSLIDVKNNSIDFYIMQSDIPSC